VVVSEWNGWRDRDAALDVPVSEDAPRPRAQGRFDAPTRQATPIRRDEQDTVSDRPPGARERPPTEDPAPVPAVSVFDPPRQRFEEKTELGRGGMGRVVEARDLALDRPVAIKHLLASGSEELARFEREVRITARLQHPSIVPILDAGRDEQGQPFYIMRKIDGEPLSKRVEAATAVRDRIALIPAVLKAIDAAAYAHAQGVIHRDIKPWNILLGPFGETLLIDWGIARELGETEAIAPTAPSSTKASGLTRVGDAVGTPGFMAPEQARGEPVDRRADVYSLGATLYFVLTGALPFAGSSATIAISEAAAGAGPDLQAIPPEVPAELSAIVIKALAARRADRYADANELAADIRRFLTGQLVAAHHYTTVERLVRWIRRHRLVAAISTIAVVAITVTAIVSFRSVVAQRDQARGATALAEARAEELLVDRARMTVATDPTSAIAMLRGLPPGSKLWPIAREIVRAAVPAGVERGLVTDANFTAAIALSSDGRMAVADDETITIHDLVRRTQRVVGTYLANRLVWRDAKTLVYANVDRGANAATLGVIDTETGTHQSVPVTEFQNVIEFNDSILVHNMDGSLDIYDEALKLHRVSRHGVVAIDVRDKRALLAGHDALVVLESGAPQRMRSINVAQRPIAARLSPDGSRAAVLSVDEILEWEIDSAAPPRRWPRSGGLEQDIEYVGDVLWAWDDSGGGLVSLEGDVPIARWPFRGSTIQRARFDDGFVLATEEGRMAIVDRLGVVTLPHRRIQFKLVDMAPDGSTLAIASLTGEVMTIDLKPVRPRLLPIAATTTVLGVAANRVIVGEATVDPFGATGSSKLAIIDVTSGKRTELGDFGFAPFVITLDSTLAISGGPGAGERELTVWDLEGRQKLRVPAGAHTQVGDGLRGGMSVIYTTREEDIVEQPVEPFGPARIVRPADGKRISRIIASPQGVAVSTLDATVQPMTTRLEWFENGPRKAPDIAYTGWAYSPGFGPDNAWWVIEDASRLVRYAPDGTRRVIELPQSISGMTIRGQRLWAVAASALYQLHPDGSLMRTVALPLSDRRGHLRDGIASLSDDGLYITIPEANISRLLQVPGGAVQQATTRDGRFIAVKTRTTPHYIAIWEDPVPLDPAAVPAFLDELTNARLDLASSAVTWDRDRP